MARVKIGIEQISESYSRLGNIWKVAEELGISGQTVARRMKSAGVQTNKRWLTDEDRSAIRSYYTETPSDIFDLNSLASRIGRTCQLIAREAASMGLTDRSRHLSAKRKAAAVGGKWRDKPHPRGMKGKRHTDETKSAVGAASRRNWATMKAFGTGSMSSENREKRSAQQSKAMQLRSGENAYSRSAYGRRDDLPGIFFRSSWEANFARYLNLLKDMNVVESWEYEPRTFRFDGVKNGVMSYRPDFLIKYRSDALPVYVEVKGWVTAKDREKWRRMAQLFPDVRLRIVGEKEYLKIKDKWASLVPCWEHRKERALLKTHGVISDDSLADRITLAWADEGQGVRITLEAA